MRTATRLARTGATVAIGAAALVTVSSAQVTYTEQPTEGDISELSQEERDLMESGAPVHVVYDADIGGILSVRPAEI